MRAKDHWIDICVLALLSSLAVLFFFSSLTSGQLINGIDDNYANRYAEARVIGESGTSIWRDSHWLGRGYRLPLNTKYIFRANLPIQWELTANLAASIGVALIFTFLFLKRLGLGRLPAAFGAIAYAFAPHYTTLVYPCHIDAMVGSAYAPLLFYLLSLAFDSGPTNGARKWAAAALTGAAWGMLMNEDPQRGLYFSVVAAAYALMLIFEIGKSREPVPEDLDNKLAPILRLALTALIFIGTFYNNLMFHAGGRNVEGQTVNTYDAGVDQRWEFATSWSLYPAELADSVAPGYHGSITGDTDQPYWGMRPVAHSSDSLGFFVVLFGFAGFLAGYRRERWIRFFTIAAILATLLAFGRYWPGKPLFWLWYHIPMMDLFRAPSKFMAVTAFSFAVLSGFGMQYLMASLTLNSKMARNMQRATMGLVLFAVFWVLYLLFYEYGIKSKTFMVLGGDMELVQTAFENSIIAVLRMLLSAAVAFAVIYTARRWKTIPLRVNATGYVFILAITVDLFATGQFYLQKSLFDPDQFLAKDEVVDFLLKEDEPGRVATSLKIDYEGQKISLQSTATGNIYLNYIFPYHGIESIDSPPAARVDRDYAAFFAGAVKPFPSVADPEEALVGLVENNLRFWRLCNVKYLVTDGYIYSGFQSPIPIMDQLNDNPGLELAGAFEGFHGRRQAVFEIKDVLPRFAFYEGVEIIDDATAAAARLVSQDFNIETRAIAAAADLPADFKRDAVPLTRPSIVEQRAGFSAIEIENEAPGLLVINSRYDHRWQAHVNGEPATTIRVNSIMTGVVLQPGTNRVELMFEESSRAMLVSSASIGAAVLAGALLLLLSMADRRDRSASPGAESR